MIGRIGVSNTGAGSGLSFGTSNSYGAGITNEAMVIDPAGNVGIGAATPSTNLHVDGNVRVTGSYRDSNNNAGTSGQVLSSSGTGTAWVDAAGADAPAVQPWVIQPPIDWQTVPSYAIPSSFKDNSGVVHLRGRAIKLFNQPIMRLPPGHQPQFRATYIAVSDNLPVVVEILPNGEVQDNILIFSWLSLDGITFSVN